MGAKPNHEEIPNQILSEKIGFTKEVDPVRLVLEQRVSLYENSESIETPADKDLDEESRAVLKEKFAEALKDAQDDLAGYEPGEDSPVVMVKLMDPAMFTDFQHRRGEIIRDMGDFSLETRRAAAKLNREVVGWGIAGHRNVDVMGQKITFSSAVVEYEDEKHTVAHNRVVKEYERLGWLEALVTAVTEYNTLTVQKKRQ